MPASPCKLAAHMGYFVLAFSDLHKCPQIDVDWPLQTPLGPCTLAVYIGIILFSTISSGIPGLCRDFSDHLLKPFGCTCHFNLDLPKSFTEEPLPHGVIFWSPQAPLGVPTNWLPTWGSFPHVTFVLNVILIFQIYIFHVVL